MAKMRFYVKPIKLFPKMNLIKNIKGVKTLLKEDQKAITGGVIYTCKGGPCPKGYQCSLGYICVRVMEP